MVPPSLSIFHPVIRSWFSERVGIPTEIQMKAWPEIARGMHVLVTAPTGSGKTLAAFLWGLNQLITSTWTRGHVRVLYISPLKALNNDVQRNLLEPLGDLREYFLREGIPFPEINVLTRSGDTPGEERRKMARKPPEILITTPESINLLLSSRTGRSLLTGIATVILDEIHAVTGTKRGTHLITAIDRIVPLAGEFQRIALSATINPAERVASFVGGFMQIGKGTASHYQRRPVSVIRSREVKAYELRVSFPSALPGEPSSHQRSEDGEMRPSHSVWPALIQAFKKIIHEHTSTLLFANSRRTTEKVTRLINEAEPGDLAYAHHGSLSREIRLAVEKKLKDGELKAIVATNSLELGIDIGSIDQVVLIQTPRSVSSTLQRIGRSGHSVGETSKGLLFPTHGMDCVNAAVMARAVLEQDIEEIRPVEAPLDVLAQVILSMTAMDRWDIDDLYAFIKASHPYRNLPRKHFDLVVEMLAGKYADARLRELKPRISIDRIDNTIQARNGAAYLIYTSGGTIPERGYFDLRLKDSRAKIGELDEEFVWERSIGETFTLGSQLWRIEKITHNDVEVVPARSATGIFPFWRAEEQDRDFHLSEKIGLFLEEMDRRLDSPDLKAQLMKHHLLEDACADELISFLKLQKEATGERLPGRHHLLIEYVEEPASQGENRQVILHTFWGGRVNRPFAHALSKVWEEQMRTPLDAVVTDDSILLMFPREAPSGDILSLVTPENVEAALRRKLEQTGFFGARFRENAERSLLLPKSGFKRRMPLWLTRLRSKQLLEAVRSYEDFPVLLETWRTCLEDEFDLENLKVVLDELHSGSIAVTTAVTRGASPFAGNLVWKQTNQYMYEDDTPLLARESALRPDLIKELLFSSHLRPKIPLEVRRILDEKLRRTAAGYPPGSSRDLLDWIKERLLIVEPEWRELAAAIQRDFKADAADWLRSLAKKVAWVSWPGARHPFLIGLEMLPRVLVAFRFLLDDISMKPVSHEEGEAALKHRVGSILRRTPEAVAPPEEYDLSSFLSAWLAFYGPIEKESVQDIFGVTADRLDEAIEPLIEAQDLVMDLFGAESRKLEICDSENLELLLRMGRRYRQPSFEARPLDQLPLFLAAFQGITPRGESMNDLQQRLEQLFGWPARAEAWEEYLLPARMQPYRSAWLDNLMMSSDLSWFGCGERRISFAFSQDLELFRPSGEYGSSAVLSELDHLIPDKRGKYSFLEIADFSQLGTGATTEKLWQQTWKGRVTSDTFGTIRKGVMTGFTAQDFTGDVRLTSRRSGFDRWKVSRPVEGHWRRIDSHAEERDALKEEELMKDRIRQLLRRSGILFRELLANELQPLQWRGLFRSIRLMELSGEVLSGHFFQGIPGPQFVSHEAFRVLRDPFPQDAVFWVNAADPASLCGLGLGSLSGLPPRLPSTHLVYCGSKLVMVSRRFGKNLEIFAPPDDSRLSDYVTLLKDLINREFNPMQKITTETLNGQPALHSPYVEALKHVGFRASRTGLELWKQY
jgi:ATP-dependent Lhr-like helicase